MSIAIRDGLFLTVGISFFLVFIAMSKIRKESQTVWITPEQIFIHKTVVEKETEERKPRRPVIFVSEANGSSVTMINMIDYITEETELGSSLSRVLKP